MKHLIFPFLIVLLVFACKRTIRSSFDTQFSVRPVNLADSLPQSAFRSIAVEDEYGIEITELPTGKTFRYFQYRAEASGILKMISSLPFEIKGVRADTSIRKIDREFLLAEKLGDVELHAASFFWTDDTSDYEVYECLKPPFKHQLLVNRKTNDIRHRIVTI